MSISVGKTLYSESYLKDNDKREQEMHIKNKPCSIQQYSNMEVRDKRNLKNVHFSPESLGDVIYRTWHIRDLLQEVVTTKEEV